MRAHPASAQGHGRFWVGLLPWAWMLFFFVLPFALIVNVSLSTPDLAVPPYDCAWTCAIVGLERRLGELLKSTLPTRACPGVSGDGP